MSSIVHTRTDLGHMFSRRIRDKEKMHQNLHEEYMREYIGNDADILTCWDALLTIMGSWNNGEQPTDIYDKISGTDAYSREDDSLYIDELSDMAAFWLQHFMVRKLAGEESTRWIDGVTEILSDLSQPCNRDILKLLVTLPRHTENQKRWNSYSTRYTSMPDITESSKRLPDVDMRISLIDNYYRRSHGSAWQEFVFRTEGNRLLIYKVKHNAQKEMLNFMFSTNSSLDCKVSFEISQWTNEFRYGRITKLSDYKQI